MVEAEGGQVVVAEGKGADGVAQGPALEDEGEGKVAAELAAGPVARAIKYQGGGEELARTSQPKTRKTPLFSPLQQLQQLPLFFFFFFNTAWLLSLQVLTYFDAVVLVRKQENQ